MRICAVIVAGGRSTRMGQEKSLVSLRGRSILARVISCLVPQVETVVINANGDAARFADFGLEVITDLRPDVGTPLAGLHAALDHAAAHAFDAVLTTPADAPFLPPDLVDRLQGMGHAAIASSGGQEHYLTGLWASRLHANVARAVAEVPPPRLQDMARRCKAVAVEWPVFPYDPFFNANTPQELAEAARIAAEFGL